MTSDYAGFAVVPDKATLLLPFVDATNQVVKAPTCTGEDRFVVLFCPSWPMSFFPHDHKVPSVLITVHTPPAPVETDDQVVNAPICTGEDRFIISF